MGCIVGVCRSSPAVSLEIVAYESCKREVTFDVYKNELAAWKCPECFADWTVISDGHGAIHEVGQVQNWHQGETGTCPQCKVFWWEMKR